MEKFTKLTGVAAPLPIVNVDTDMIIPKDYLKTIKRTGLSVGLFAEMRFNEDGSGEPRFRAQQACLPQGADPGCRRQFRLRLYRASMRPGRLLDFGIRCVISTSLRRYFLQ